MKAAPVIRYRTPRYPTRLQALADPTLLERHLPSAWKSRTEMAGLMTLLLASNNCSSFAQKLGVVTGKPAVVAPIFKHGEGRGATGCVVVNPPVFLSEQDAMQVIKEELGKAGVVFSETNVPLRGVGIPQQREDWSTVNGTLQINTVLTGESKDLVLDGFDPQKKIGAEYVAAEDYFDLGGGQSNSTVQDYDFRGVTTALNKEMKAKAHDLYFGAFYDPMVNSRRDTFENPAFRKKLTQLYEEKRWTKDPAVAAQKEKEIDLLYDQQVAPIRAEAQRLLRMQVKDFIDWLKGQGAI